MDPAARDPMNPALGNPASRPTVPPLDQAAASKRLTQSFARAPVPHPLDPLHPAEIAVAIATARMTGSTPEVRDAMRIVECSLHEPSKDVVAMADAHFFPPFRQDWHLPERTRSGPAPPPALPNRQARVIVYNKKTNETTVLVVELLEVKAAPRSGHSRGKVVSAEVVPDVQPPMDAEEYAECEAVVKAHVPFVDAMRKRGVDDMELVMVDPWCVGYFDERDDPAQRLAKPLVFCRTPSERQLLDNGYARPVEGLHILVDLRHMRILEFEDRQLVPLPPPDPLRNYTDESSRGTFPDRADVRPLLITQPEGPSFRVTGHAVDWQKWSFRVGFTPREGLVLHSVAYDDGSRGRRSIANRLSFCEMVVPYGDPSEPHFRKNAFDAGEDGLGKNANSLKKGCDCVGHIHYWDAHFSNFGGGVETIENCVCMHEEDAGVLWKHMDWRSGETEVRRSRRLVLSFFCTVANYEYGFFWYFYQDGKLEAEVKLTGILSLGALKENESFRKHGTTIAPGLYAPVHQHFFVARLNMAVDSRPGQPSNQVVEWNVQVDEPGPENPHKNAFHAEQTLLASELQGCRDCDPLSARHWTVQNSRTVNRTGRPTGYKLIPGANVLPLADPDAKFMRRAEFLKHNLWVTKFEPNERYPGGEFPNQNPRVGEGICSWIKADRSLVDTDLVLWYVFGITHVPRLEDWPVMPVEHIGFTLAPDGFFNASPAIDVPPSEADEAVEEDHAHSSKSRLAPSGALASRL
eukprot:SM000199S05428  [mRNA]  locus=s199:197527:202985:- [translate_table: standard]